MSRLVWAGQYSTASMADGEQRSDQAAVGTGSGSGLGIGVLPSIVRRESGVVVV
ncbi:MAG: hypothetical protein V2A73_04470 [Pseudomonadota bacterium]